MKDQILKIAKVKSEKEFYKKYPTEEAFMAKHGKTLQKAAMGKAMVNKQLHQLTDFGNPPIAQDGGSWANYGIPGMSTATYNKSTGLVNNASGSVSQADTQALGFGKNAPGGGGGFNSGAAGMTAVQGIGQVIGGIQAIGAQKKAQKKAEQAGQLSGLALQASQTMEKPKNQYVTPYDVPVQPGQLGNPYGTGTNYLQAQNGTMIGGNPTEIQNTYAPTGTLYNDLGYEPLNDSNPKQYQKGGKLISRDKINIDSYGNQGTAFRDIFQNPNMTQDTTYAYDSPTAMLRYNTNGGNPYAYVGGRGGFNSAQPDSLAKYKQLLSSPFNSDEPGGMRRLASGKYEKGGNMPKAEFGDYFQDSGQAQVGSAVGGAIAQGFGLPPEVGQLVGKVAGNLLGGAKDARKLQAEKDKTALNQSQMAFQQTRSDQFKANLEEGGWVSNDWQPQTITKFGDYSVKDLLKPPHDADMLRSGGHLAQVPYTPPSAAALYTGRPDMPKGQVGVSLTPYSIADPFITDTVSRSRAKDMATQSPQFLGSLDTGGDLPEAQFGLAMEGGGRMTSTNMMFDTDKYPRAQDGTQMAMDGELQVLDGGRAETISQNPFLPNGGEMIMFKGRSHDNGGIPIQYGENGVEVEGNEPAVKLKDGGNNDNLVVFGNIKINKDIANLMEDKNAEGRKFKTYMADIGKNDAKQQKSIQKGLELIEQYNGNSVFDQLGMNSGMAKLMGGTAQQKINAEKIKNAALVQDSIHQTANELGVKSDKLAEGKLERQTDPSMAKSGKTLKKAQSGYEVPDFLRTPRVNIPYKQGYNQAQPEFMQRLQTPSAPQTFSGNPAFEQSSDIYSSDPSFGSKALDAIKSAGDFLGKGAKQYGPSILSNAAPFLRPTNQQGLDPEQLYPEYYAMATNQLEPVKAQTFQPMLDTPYDISLNDQLSAIDSQSRAIMRQVGNNPGVLANIAAQTLQAKNQVLGEQNRINQANKMQTYSKNRELLNQAQLQNLGILDQQYVRQAQAKSNTKAQALEALKSIAAKTAQNKLENRQLATYENLYNYRFSPSGVAYNANEPYQFNIPSVGNLKNLTNDDVAKIKELYEKTTTRDKVGNITGSKEKSRTSTNSRNGSIVKALKTL